ncbi:MAG TPA: winged helix DNA-binding domain-containing protein [Gaiellaceae bacterium]|nr:winged helix DNA-binding domain-containing protein [Gaiellaceae bacterium]
MAERVLTLRELNRTVLQRQLLLRRERLTVARAIERVAALQAQWAPAPYVALWARLEGFQRRALERALARGSVVKALLMRATMHLVSARDYPWLDGCVRESRTLVRVRGTARPHVRVVERALELVRERPLTRPELMRQLGYDPRTQDPDELREQSWIVALARLEQTPEAAFWSFRGSPLLRAAEHELPPRSDAAAYLIRRYLSAFGPATRADVSAWSGVPIRDLQPGFESLRLRSLRDEQGRELLDLPRAPLARPDVLAPPRLLPRWEELLLAHKDRTRVLPDEYRSQVIAVNGDVRQAVLVDGFVAGWWEQRGERVVVHPFAPLPRQARRELEDEAARLGAWLR